MFANVIKDQVSGTDRCEIFLGPSEACKSLGQGEGVVTVPSHPLAAELKQDESRAVEHLLKLNANSKVSSNSKSRTSPRTVPGLVQTYSGKSNTTLKASEFKFYPNHIIMLKFANDNGR